MANCTECNKRFIETSWTRSAKWRAVCPKCIVEMLEKLEAMVKGGSK